ncbi:hypothetical protein SPI_06927 [Niveomyces insectorum RCEF 264]|uniref:Uncharacterized protein n=1 Tax=Niveomyces insectorum RCEF 264 TaxID=1081102 RepID=A0A167QWT0_9HYPO|nr:hypothetical protein SPI_06927 [Niveomyces insectorum RCEF 264]
MFSPAAAAPPSAPPSSRSTDDDMSSLLVAALPASIQSRIPKLPSLRRSISMQSVFFRSGSDSPLASSVSTSSGSPSLSPSSSPPSSRPTTSGAASVASWSRGGSSPELGELDLVLASDRQNQQPRPDQPPSQVNWKYGQNGFRSLQSALREAGDPDRLPELERRIYVESMAYLLRGLPRDLDHGELDQLRHAAPAALVDSTLFPLPLAAPQFVNQQLVLQQQHQSHLAVYTAGSLSTSAAAGGGTATPGPQPMRRKRSLPHAVTHWLVTRVYALILLLLPVATDFVRWAVAVERQYHVPEAVLRWATASFLVFYRSAIKLFVAVCSMGDGCVGQALDAGAVYLANGVVLGFREAVVDVARGQL